jgi:hypothetical protein
MVYGSEMHDIVVLAPGASNITSAIWGPEPAGTGLSF